MVYTIVGIVIGGAIGGMIRTRPNPNFANVSQMFNIVIGAAIGGGIGFGLGISSLTRGRHIIQKIPKWISNVFKKQ